MIPLTRLSNWRLRLSRLCGLSHSTGNSSRKPRPGSRSSASSEFDIETVAIAMEQVAALREFIERMTTLENNSFFNTNMEFAKLRSAQDNLQMHEEYSMSEGFSALQNRYRDVVPYNKNRVQLENNESGDYINASMMAYPDVDRLYIAAQAPLSSTIDDFWHMIGQYRIKIVVMLCKVVENSIVKCVQYWPLKVNDKMELTDGTLETLEEEHLNEDFCIRKILFKSNKFGESIVHQLHYTEWPDHGCPDTDLHIPKFIETMDDYQLKYGSDAPILVHCSAGCGRTGTVIGVDIHRALIRENKIKQRIDLRSFVFELRKQRTSCVQSVSQYQLLHTLIAHYCKLALIVADSSEPINDEHETTPNTTVVTLPLKTADECVDCNGVSPSLSQVSPQATTTTKTEAEAESVNEQELNMTNFK